MLESVNIHAKIERRSLTNDIHFPAHIIVNHALVINLARSEHVRRRKENRSTVTDRIRTILVRWWRRMPAHVNWSTAVAANVVRQVQRMPTRIVYFELIRLADFQIDFFRFDTIDRVADSETFVDLWIAR